MAKNKCKWLFGLWGFFSPFLLMETQLVAFALYITLIQSTRLIYGQYSLFDVSSKCSNAKVFVKGLDCLLH